MDDDGRALRLTLAVLAMAYALVTFWGLLLWSCSADSRELYPGQYAQVSPETQKWFREQRSPKTKIPCCNEADGAYAQEEITDGHYRTRFTYAPWTYPFGGPPHKEDERDSGWMDVPDDVVIHDPNRNGAPVVWWYMDNDVVTIRCYAPGAGL